MEKWACIIENDPNFQIASAILMGFLLSGISWGFVYVILFLIIWEIGYFAYTDCNDKEYDLLFRVTLALAAFLGYLAGRNFHDMDDHYQDCCDFFQHCKYYF